VFLDLPKNTKASPIPDKSHIRNGGNFALVKVPHILNRHYMVSVAVKDRGDYPRPFELSTEQGKTLPQLVEQKNG
jgi:hypothetical protein